MKKILLVAILYCVTGCVHAQTKTQKQMEEEKIKLETLIKEELSMVTHYPHHPAYYVQVNKAGCRLLVSVNNIPLGYSFIENAGETMLYPINDLLFGSGEHTLSIEVFPQTTQTEVSAGTWVNLKIIRYEEKHGDQSVTLEELDVPTDIGTKRLPIYRDSIRFTASLPFDHRKILAEAVDLHKVPDLEKKVLAHYNKVRNMMINGDHYEYHKMRLATTWVQTEINYLGEEALRKVYLSPDELFRFNCDVIDWTALPIENYEMVVCGHGKLVYLRRKKELDEVLRTEYYDTQEEKQKYPDKRTTISFKFIALYMPNGSEELVELY